MKIRPDQIEGVQPEQTQRKNKTQQSGQAFGDILNQEVARENPSAQGVAPPPIVNPLLNVQAPAATRTGGSEAAVGQVESILDQWDDYAAALADPQAGLKAAYGSLDKIADDVAALKEGQPDLDPGLKAIVDDLETLAATEQYKFNRGDYL
jgi:hypothetical protein